MAVTHPQPLTHANLKVTAQPWCTGYPNKVF
jgi:hypothetical protein